MRILVGSCAWVLGLATIALPGCDEPLPEPSRGLADTDGAGDDEDDDAENDDDDDDTPAGDDDDDDAPAGDDDDDDDDDDDAPAGDDDDDDDDTPAPGDDDDDDTPAADCDDNVVSLIPYGWATASSVFETWFSSYPADLAIDGDVGTSWFSAGPESDGTASEFEFVMMNNHCIDQIEVEGNGSHDNSDFHLGYGYEWVTVEVLDTGNKTVFLEEYSLEGTPDEMLSIDTGGVLGHKVVLHLTGHESPDCGGFSELRVHGRNPL